MPAHTTTGVASLPRFSLAFLAALVMLAAPAHASKKLFNLSLPVISPVLQFSGSISETYDTGGDWVGQGTPLTGDSIRRLDEYSTTIDFAGTNIQFLGNASDTSVVSVSYGQWQYVTETSANSSVIAAAQSNLTYAWYEMVVTQTNSDTDVWMTGVDINTALETEFDSIWDAPNRTEAVVDSLGDKNEFFYFYGQWAYNASIGSVPSPVGRPYNHLVGSGDAYLNFNVPQNTSFIIINGTVGYLGGHYNVTLDPPLSGTQDYTLGSESPPNPFTFNSESRWESEAVLFAAPLDPTEEYDVIIDNIDTDGSVGVYGATFYFATNPPSSNVTSTPSPGHPGRDPKSHTGAIIGGVIGGVVGVTALVVLAYFLGRRRRAPLSSPEAVKTVEPSSKDDRFDIDRSPESTEAYKSYLAALPMTQTGGEATPNLVERKMDELRREHEVNSHESLLNPSPTNPSSGVTTASALLTSRALNPNSFSNLREMNLTPSDHAGSIGSAGPSNSSKTQLSSAPAPVAPAPPPRFTQASDAGPIEALEIIPPSYDPSWAPTPPVDTSPVDSMHSYSSPMVGDLSAHPAPLQSLHGHSDNGHSPISPPDGNGSFNHAQATDFGPNSPESPESPHSTFGLYPNRP